MLGSALHFCSVVQYTCIECGTSALSELSARRAALGECSVTLRVDGGGVGQVLLGGGAAIAEQWKWRHISRLVAFS